MIMTTYVAWAERVPGVQERSQNYPINARLTQPPWTHSMHCCSKYQYISDGCIEAITSTLCLWYSMVLGVGVTYPFLIIIIIGDTNVNRILRIFEFSKTIHDKANKNNILETKSCSRDLLTAKLSYFFEDFSYFDFFAKYAKARKNL